MDLDLWDCFGRTNTPSYNRRNTVILFISPNVDGSHYAWHLHTALQESFNIIMAVRVKLMLLLYLSSYKTGFCPSRMTANN